MPEIFHLRESQIPVAIFLGSIDTQLDDERQYAFFTAHRHLFPDIAMTMLTDVGHTLGVHALLDPVADACQRIIVNKIIELAYSDNRIP